MQDLIIFMQHHGLLSVALGVILLLIIFIELIRAKRVSQQLSPAEVTALINKHNAVVVDIRSTDAYTSGHIIDAISLPLSDLTKKLNKLEKYKSKPLILICAMGHDSLKATPQLTQQGYTVNILSGGLRAWRSANLPLVKDK